MGLALGGILVGMDGWVGTKGLFACCLTLCLYYSMFQFVAAGGLQQLLEIFLSGILEPKEQESWTVVRANSILKWFHALCSLRMPDLHTASTCEGRLAGWVFRLLCGSGFFCHVWTLRLHFQRELFSGIDSAASWEQLADIFIILYYFFATSKGAKLKSENKL